MRRDIHKRKEEILTRIAERQSKTYICKQFGCAFITLNRWLDTNGIEYSGTPGKGNGKYNRRLSAIEYSKSTHVSLHKMRQKLIEDGIKDKKCEKCNKSKWLREDIPLELHHADGNRYNNSLDNLQILCPNCHAQTITNSGKNIGRYAGMGELLDPSDLGSDVRKGVQVGVLLPVQKTV